MAQAVDFIRFGLSDASGGIDTIDKFAGKGFGMALSCGQVVVVMIEAHMKSIIAWGNTRNVIERCIEGCSASEVVGPVTSRFDGIEEARGYRAAVSWFQGISTTWLGILLDTCIRHPRRSTYLDQ
jgi:hypothetical protein